MIDSVLKTPPQTHHKRSLSCRLSPETCQKVMSSRKRTILFPDHKVLHQIPSPALSCALQSPNEADHFPLAETLSRSPPLVQSAPSPILRISVSEKSSPSILTDLSGFQESLPSPLPPPPHLLHSPLPLYAFEASKSASFNLYD